MRTYNLFRRNAAGGVYCAVPEDCAVPRFVRGRGWSYGGRVEPDNAPIGFDAGAVDTSVRFNGFYIFQAFRTQRA